MRATKQSKSEEFVWQNFKVQLNYEQNSGLQLYLRNTLNKRKFKTFYYALPDSLKFCNYGSLEELYCDLSGILGSKDKSELSRFKIEENGTIKISKKSLNGRGKVGQLYTQQYFYQETPKDSSDQQIKVSNFSKDITGSTIHKMPQIIQKLQRQIFKLQNQTLNLKKTVQDLVNQNNKNISSLGSNKYNRRRQFMKQFLGQQKKMEKVFIKNFICDFYQRKNRLEIFFVNVQNADEFFIKIQNSDLVYKISKNIEYYIKNNIIQQKVSISNSGIFKIKGLQSIAGELVEREQCYEGQKIKCNSIQNIRKDMQTQKEKYENSVNLWKAQMKKQFQNQKLSIEGTCKAQFSQNQSKIMSKFQQKTLYKFLNINDPNSVKLNLLYRASDHNYLALEFHKKCDNIPNTVVVAKTQFGNVIGGFTPVKWEMNSKGYIKDQSKKSFLFSLTNREKFTLQQPDFAIYSKQCFGPGFGRGNDFFISNQSDEYNQKISSYANIGCSYKNENYREYNQQEYTRFTGSTKDSQFLTQEYQVFEVIFNN